LLKQTFIHIVHVCTQQRPRLVKRWGKKRAKKSTKSLYILRK